VSTVSTVVKGLEGVVAAETRLSKVDGQAGELTIGGFAVEVLAPQASFEEVLHLLWHDALPTAGQLAELRNKMLPQRTLPQVTLAVIKAAAAARVHPMDALRMGCATLSIGDPDPDDNRVEANLERAIKLAAGFPTMVATFWRLKDGQAPIPPRDDLGHAANYLYMLSGKEPDPAVARALETYLNTVVDHGLNASTFTARVIVSTQSDMISAVTGAIGALKGPLHGGAPGPALDMVFEIGQAEKAEAYLKDKLARGERIMGFGHRVYKVRDPRAEVLSQAADALYERAGDRSLYELAQGVEKIAVRMLEEYKPGRNLQTNVEFYTALLLHGAGLESDIFSSTFASGRVGGWTAHVLEQQRANRLIRPSSAYIGAFNRRWVPLERR
jgi:citrate synthase